MAPSRTQDERSVLRSLLPGHGTVQAGGDFTCGGYTASGEAWEALGLLIDMCVASRTARMRPDDFKQRLMRLRGGAARGDTAALDIVIAAWRIAQYGSESSSPNAKRRNMILSTWLAGTAPATTAGAAFEEAAGRIYGEGVWRISRMLAGVHKATRGRGLGLSCWRIWSGCVESLAGACTTREQKWRWLGPLCTQVLRANDKGLHSRDSGFPTTGHLDAYLRERIALAVGVGQGNQGAVRPPAPEPEDWFSILRVVVHGTTAHGRGAAESYRLARALDALAETGARIADSLGDGLDGRKELLADCGRLAKPDKAFSGSGVAEGAGSVLALLRQAQQCERIGQAPASGRTRRRS